MNRDDIIRMAREAGASEFRFEKEPDFTLSRMTKIERFAALVAAAVLPKEALAEMFEWGKDAGRREEREAIAKMIEDAPPLVDFAKNEHDGCLMCGFTPKLAAASIRAKGQS